MPVHYPPGVHGPAPLWAISAEHNADMMARRRHAKIAAGIVARLVTKHPVPWFGEPVTAAARTLERTAQAAGMTTKMSAGLDECRLEGRVPGEHRGFVAWWKRGRADVALWIEPETVWQTVPDTRPIGIAKLTRTTLKGHRDGSSDTRGIMASSRTGVIVSFAELTKRIKAIGARP